MKNVVLGLFAATCLVTTTPPATAGDLPFNLGDIGKKLLQQAPPPVPAVATPPSEAPAAPPTAAPRPGPAPLHGEYNEKGERRICDFRTNCIPDTPEEQARKNIAHQRGRTAGPAPTHGNYDEKGLLRVCDFKTNCTPLTPEEQAKANIAHQRGRAPGQTGKATVPQAPKPAVEPVAAKECEKTPTLLGLCPKGTYAYGTKPPSR